MTEGQERLYLDDLGGGQRFASGPQALDAGQIKAFAEAFDPQPFHLDEWPRLVPVRGPAASGWHTAAISMRLLVDSVPLAGGVVGADGDCLGRGRPGPATCSRSSSEVLEVTPSRSRPDRGTVTLRSETRNQRGEVVQTLTARLVVPRRPRAEGPPEGNAAG